MNGFRCFFDGSSSERAYVKGLKKELTNGVVIVMIVKTERTLFLI